MAAKFQTMCLLTNPQDVAEYFQHLLSLMERAERTAGSRLGDLGSAGATPDAFRFGVETRIQVQALHVVLTHHIDVG